MSIIRRLTALVAIFGLFQFSLAEDKPRELKIYNWVSYIDRELIDEFTAQTVHQSHC